MEESMAEKKFDLGKALNSLKESTGMVSFAESTTAFPEDYLDTGNLALNRIITGDTSKGIPVGYVTLLAGPSQSGKSYIAAKAACSALAKNYKAIFIMDSEGGTVSGLLVGADGKVPSNVYQVLIPNAEEAIIISQKILDFIKEAQASDPASRFLIIIDSLGALRSKKIAEDASGGKNVAEVGGTSKKIGEFLTLLTIPCLQTHTACIVLSHTYESFSMMPTKIDPIFGGNKAYYIPSVTIQTKSTPKKEDKMIGNVDENTFYQGVEFVYFTVKNRFIRSFFECRSMNNFTSGENKYYGLFPVAEGYGLIVRESSMYKIPEYSGEKKWYGKDILTGKEADAIWEKLIPLINEKSKVDMAYGSVIDAPGLSEAAPESAKKPTGDGGVVLADLDSNSTDHMKVL
jgi:RecA/RadA recombinase